MDKLDKRKKTRFYCKRRAGKMTAMGDGLENSGFGKTFDQGCGFHLQHEALR